MSARLSRQEQRERTRERVMLAAEKAFSERGYHGASLDQIAEDAGYSKGAVYSNFGSKEELFLALLDRRAQMEEAQLAASVGTGAAQPEGGGGRPMAEPSGWALATLDFFLVAVRRPELRSRLAEGYRRSRASTGRLLPAEGCWATPEELATVVMALGSGLIIQSSLEPADVPADLFERALARLMDAS